MARPKLIPQDLYPEILSRAGKNESTDAIAAWLTETMGKKVDGRRVRAVLEKVRRERAPIAKAVIADRLGKTLNADLDAVDQLLKDAEKYQQNAAKLQDIAAEIERFAKVDIAKAVDANGKLLSLAVMEEDVRRAISSIEVEELFEGQGEEREKVGDLVKVRFWDKPKGLELLAKIRSGHMAMQAMEMQKKLLELRFKLSGASGGGDGEGGVVMLPPEGD